jgi:quercetin dioxygenase-like cupin family protein
MTKTHVTIWTSPDRPAEADLRRLFSDEGLVPYEWSNAPLEVYSAHTHPHHKVLYVVRGSITFGLPREGRKIVLNPGDRLDLPPGTLHDAVVSSQGVTCLEAYR